jgi:hypothetical protein
MLDRLYAQLGTRDIPGEPEALERLAIRVAQLATLNGEDWVRANRNILLMQWRIALGPAPLGGAEIQQEKDVNERDRRRQGSR